MTYPDYQNVLTESGLSTNEIKHLFSSFKASDYEKDQHLLKTGEIFDHVYLIQHGAIRMYYLTPEGQESNKLFFFENHLVFPVAPIARDKPSLFGIAACEHTRVLQLPFHDFKSRLESFNAWEYFYLRYLEWLVNEKVSREHRLLTLNKKQRIQDLAANESRLFNRINDYQIASYLGMSPVTFSRLKHSP
ncbi:Crp/Fnr family transcriptional regulator [Vibrio salinus]|uniref:Crp/Fnr family transcriptional regulator n=1 Tax=Vibrio salinus TaxID=2899784 RepID=UPI001E28F4AA|nr:Crp/Fnr family transcriptional regulator [Vibrio salinus]MCE0496105.1 Crp/Fnr family transcriptional regulator [Vibrio salinus]